MRVLFVCLGNICRSPMAEMVFRDKVQKAGLEDRFTIASAATSSWELGNPPHYGTRAELKKHGISCGNKRAVRLKASDYDEYDLIEKYHRLPKSKRMRILGYLDALLE